MAPQFLLKLINPASAYMHEMDRRERRNPPAFMEREAPAADLTGSGVSTRPVEASLAGAGTAPVASGWAERAAELDGIYLAEADRGAKELLARGLTTMPTHAGTLAVRLVRFWNGTAIVEYEQLRGGRRGSGASLLDRRTLRERAESFLSRTLLAHIREMDRDASPGSWGPPPPPRERVLSPGGWVPPPGVRPMWNWTPPGGGTARPDLMPWWVKAWFRTPFIDRWAHPWMWDYGGWEVEPPSGTGDGPGDESGDREPRLPKPSGGVASVDYP